MNKNKAIIIATLGALALPACNSNGTEYHEAELAGSTMVKGFSLVENDKLLADLDSVFFSIDLVKGEIFNADSLPKDTRINGLAATILTDNASGVTLYIPREGKEDSVVNYLEHTTDTIDFSHGPVRVEVTSQNGLNKQTYSVRVNVHTVVSDSLCWGSSAYTALPAVASAKAQHTVQKGGMAYTFSTDGSSYGVAATGTYATWDMETFVPGFDMDVNSIVAGDPGFFALDGEGRLYRADAAAGPWTATAARFHSLYGIHEGILVGCTLAEGNVGIDTYPSVNMVIEPAEGMPVEGFSPGVTLTATNTQGAEQLIITGGRCADGTLSASSYGFDGHAWAKLSEKALPAGLEGAAVAPYYSLRNKKIVWRVNVLPTLLCFGGRLADGSVNKVVYMSRDWGMHWVKADQMLQPTPELPQVYGAQTLVAEHTFGLGRSDAWHEFGMMRLPLGARLETASNSRATTAITEWEAPYIYLFGGYDSAGELNDAVWRGVITRFTFKPIQ
ncbi:MAG: hypothetical protein K2M12_04935 [Muribaculaceae bacterium]|nr:hypothetical protein [Muribaculaceae bacterium]